MRIHKNTFPIGDIALFLYGHKTPWLLALLACCLLLPTQDILAQSQIDPIRENYTGYRIYVQSAKVVKDKRKMMKMSLRLVNTGSNALTNKTKKEYGEQIIVKEDGAFDKSGKGVYADLILEELKDYKRYKMESGQSQTIEIKVKIPKDRVGQDEGGFQVNTEPANTAFNRDLCPDLVVDSLVLLERKKKHALVEFTVRNDGKGAINVIGEARNKQDNVTIGAYFSGTPNYSAGAISAHQEAMTGLEDTQGILFPGQSIRMQMKVSRKKQSKYVRMLIVRVDSRNMVLECQEGNNARSVMVK